MTFKHGEFNCGFSGAGRLATLVLVAALLSSNFPIGVWAQPTKSRTAQPNSVLTEEQRILHVMNRLGFGARPGDVERVKRMGVDSYINEQLSPEKISDVVADAKVKHLATLNMTTAELYEKFPQPGLLLRQLERRGELPAALAVARDKRVKGTNGLATPSTNSTDAQVKMEGSEGQQMVSDKADVNKGNDNGEPSDNRKYRQAIREFYLRNGLQPPQRIMAELQASRILRAVYSERQLQEVMVDFWTNHFNVFAGKGADRWLLVSYDRDTIRPNVMAKFSDLLLATAQSPAMLFYLDNFQSVSPTAQLGGAGQRRRVRQDPMAQPQIVYGTNDRNREPLVKGNDPQQLRPEQQRRRGINENYARELMELHTLGVDGGYTQKDVQEVARCFTGWTIIAPRGGAVAAQSMINGPRADMLRENAGRFFFNPRAHDEGEKIVLGRKIPAGGGIKDGLIVLDILAHHSSTAKHVATKLLRHFVSDNPSTVLVERVAAVFTKSRGDIRETLRAIFFSPEFNSAEAYRGKIKRPFELAISSIRTLGADTTGGPQLHQWIARMGEPLYGFPTPNGYSDTAESWVNTGGLLERMNFGLTLANSGISGTRVDLKQFLINGKEAAQSLNETQIVDRYLNLLINGDVSPKTREALMKQFNEKAGLAVPAKPETPRQDTMDGEMMEAPTRRQQRQQLARADANITDPVTRIVGLILGSPEFQRQ